MSGQSPWDAIVPAIVSGGLGAGLAAIATALIQTWGRRAESRATAADLITDAAGALAARQGETILRLETRVARQARAIAALTAVLDEMLPQVPLSDPERARLRKAIMAAKMAV